MKLKLVKVRLNRGGYAPNYNHKYFGLGEPVYYFEDCNDTDGDHCFIRAKSRDEAKAKIRSMYKCTEVKFNR